MNENWKPIEGYQDYEVSDLGRVRSWRIKGNTTKPVTEPRILKFSMCGDKRRYQGVKLYRNNKGKSHRVHRLVLEAFVGPMPDGLECLHSDGNPVNNRLDNLRYGTHIENMEDQRRHGTIIVRKGEQHSMAILNENQVKEIRKRYSDGGITYKTLGSIYGVDSTTIGYIVRRQLWSHIS